MPYQDRIRDIGSDPEQLELAYQDALKAGEGDAFAAALLAAHAAAPDDLLYSAWRYRLAQGLAQAVAQTKQRVIAWSWAVPLALVNALLLWLLSDERIEIRIDDRSFGPGIVLLAAPISALAVLAFLVAAGPRRGRRALLTAAGIAAVTGYAWLLHPRVTPRAFEEQVLALMGMHVPVLAWSAVGLYLLWSARDAANRFAFLIKSLELFIAGGLFGIACGLFVGISMGMFAAIAIEPPEIVIRLFVAGGGGLVPVLAAAICYDPRHLPARQSFEEGLSRFIATLMRVLLPLTLVVLAVYVVLIPLHFRAAFENRDVLIIYNGMLFAVLALLVGATPVPDAEPTGRTKVWLRRLMVAIALLALVVGAYALAAIVYRTTKDVLTPNRVTFIGWNLVNLGVLLTLLVKQARVRGGDALASLRETFALAMVPYAAWALCVVLVLPWLFDTPPKGIEGLPPSIQDMVLAEPGPILLKCGESPHIYLLEDGRKRWVKDIPTFETQGYTWDDVREYVTCDEIDDIPDGPPIPEDAGRPPLLARPTVTAGAAKFDAFIAHL